MAANKKLALMGCGYLGGIVAKAWKDGFLPGYELVGVASRSSSSAQALSEAVGVPACPDLAALLALHPDYLVETASVQCVREIALPVLEAGVDLVLISIGALADEAFTDQLSETAARYGAQVHIASGAVGGFDVLQTLTLMAKAMDLKQDVELLNYKNPHGLLNTPLYRDDLTQAPADVFQGTAAQAIALLPTKVNVAVATSLATTGPDHARSHICTIPDYESDNQRITVEVDGGYKAVVDIYIPSSDIAGWSLVSLLRNLNAPICLY